MLHVVQRPVGCDFKRRDFAVVQPDRNQKDLVDIPQQAQDELDILFVKRVDEVLPLVLSEVPGQRNPEAPSPRPPQAPGPRPSPTF